MDILWYYTKTQQTDGFLKVDCNTESEIQQWAFHIITLKPIGPTCTLSKSFTHEWLFRYKVAQQSIIK